MNKFKYNLICFECYNFHKIKIEMKLDYILITYLALIKTYIII